MLLKLILILKRLETKDFDDRNTLLSKFFKKTRIQYIRLLVLLKWRHRLKDIKTSQELLQFLRKQEHLLEETADKLWALQKSVLRGAK